MSATQRSLATSSLPRSFQRDGNVYFANLPALVEGGFRPGRGIGANWVAFDYEVDDFAGIGLATGALSKAGELVLDLGLQGWHILHFCHTPVLDVWLDGEKGLRALDGPQGSAIRDYPIHAADLTGRKLHIAPKRGCKPKEAILFYIRAEPCSGPRASHRNLVSTEDGHGVFWAGMDHIREIYKYFYPYRDSDFFRVLWGVFGGGDVSTDPESNATTILPNALAARHMFYADEKVFTDSIRRVMKEGDILKTVVEAARDVNMEVHFYFRVGIGYPPFPHDGNRRTYFHRHPRFHCRDEFGRDVKRTSFAFPEVQDHLIEYFDELMDYGADGICLAFNRGLPLMVCEEPVLAEFERRHGRRPKLPEEVDSEEMLAVRHELLAGFVERLSRRLSGRGKALSCIVPRNFRENRLRGLDLPMLLQRGLLESVMVGAGHEDNPLYTKRTHQAPVDQDDLKPVKQLKAIGTAKIYLGGCSGHGTFWPAADPVLRARRMRSILEAGLDGGYFWDVNQWWSRDWEDIRQYGDRAHLDLLIASGPSAAQWRDTRRIGDLVVDRYSPWNAH